MDATNPFAGGLPPPPSHEDEEIDPSNPFYGEEDDHVDAGSDKNLENPNTPGLPTNPFYEEQQKAINQHKLQQALEEQQEEYEERQQIMQQQYQQYERQLTQQQQQYQYQQQQIAQQKSLAQQQNTMPQPQPQPPPANIGLSNHNQAESKEEPLNEAKPEEKKESEEDLKEGKRQRNRVRAVDELIATERTYVVKLELLNEIYIDRMKKNEKLMKSKFHSIIFPQVLQTILILNKKLLKSMELNTAEIGSTMIDFIPYLKMYQNYMNNHESATRLIKQLRGDKNSEFCKYLSAKEMEQNGFTLESYLILPIQRMPRYELCLKEIIKLTLEQHSDMKHLKKCYESVSFVNKQINIRMKDYETRQKVYEIEERIINLEINRKDNKNKSRKLARSSRAKSTFLFNNKRNSKSALSVFDDLKDISRTRLVQPWRIFIKQGYLYKVSRKKDIKYLFILFNDLLMYCYETMNGNKLILHQKIDITDAYFRIESAVILDDDIDYTEKTDKKNDKTRHNTFEIHSIQKSFLCYAENAKEREEWIEAIETCMDNIKKSGITKVHKDHDAGPGADYGRKDSMALMNASGSSRYSSVMMAATSPLNIIDATEDEGRVLETAPMFVPNDWSDECMMQECTNKFRLLLNKRNHCRYCGKLVCNECCTHTLPHFEPTKRKGGVHVKVCGVCHDKYKVKPLINIDQMHAVSKNINENKIENEKEPSLQIEESKESKSNYTDDSSDWEELYDNMHNAQNVETPGAASMIIIPQSISPQVSNGADVLSLFDNPNAIITRAHTQHSSYFHTGSNLGLNRSSLNFNLNPMKNVIINPVHSVSMNAMHNVEPGTGVSGGFDDIEDIDPTDNPLPEEKSFSPVALDVNKVKYDEDMGTVNAIIAANETMIKSMDLRAYSHDDNDEKSENVVSVIVLDENAEAHDSEDSDDFAANFENIVIPESCKAVNQECADALYSFLDSPHNNKQEKKKVVHINVMDLDVDHDNVKQLTLFGFTEQNVVDAWALMKKNKEHKHIVPDHGPLFTETILDYLNKVQKQKSKDVIMGKYKDQDLENANELLKFQF